MCLLFCLFVFLFECLFVVCEGVVGFVFCFGESCFLVLVCVMFEFCSCLGCRRLVCVGVCVCDLVFVF